MQMQAFVFLQRGRDLNLCFSLLVVHLKKPVNKGVELKKVLKRVKEAQ